MSSSCSSSYSVLFMEYFISFYFAFLSYINEKMIKNKNKRSIRNYKKLRKHLKISDKV